MSSDTLATPTGLEVMNGASWWAGFRGCGRGLRGTAVMNGTPWEALWAWLQVDGRGIRATTAVNGA